MRRPSLETVGNALKTPSNDPDATGTGLPRPKLPKTAQWAKIPRPGIPQKEGLKYYVGDEVCLSPFFGHATLFVIGLQHSIKEIIGYARTNKSYHKTINHIYLGANRTYKTADNTLWEDQVDTLLKAKYYVSLEVALCQANDFREWAALENSNFCLLLRWLLPDATKFRNAAVLIDDQNFLGDNGGVWTHAMADLTVSEGRDFSPWAWFAKDSEVQ